MAAVEGAKPRIYLAPSAQGNLESTGLKGWIARRPLTAFLVIVLVLSWLILAVPVLAFYRVIPGASLPVEIFALASTLLGLLPAAIWVLILAVAVRLMVGLVLRAAADSVLAVGILHQIFDASNNKGGLVDSFLDGADAGLVTQIGTIVLILLVAAILWRRPGAFAKRQTPEQTKSSDVATG